MSQLQVEIKKITGILGTDYGAKFEVIVRHDLKIIKCKGKTQIDKTQVWDNPIFTMLCYPKYNIDIRIKELKLFKSKILAEMTIPITIFYKEPTKYFIINLNSSETLKLELKMTLNLLPDPNLRFINNRKQLCVSEQREDALDINKKCLFYLSKSLSLGAIKSKLNFESKEKEKNDGMDAVCAFNKSCLDFNDTHNELGEKYIPDDNSGILRVLQSMKYNKSNNTKENLQLNFFDLNGTYKKFYDVDIDYE
uniref:PL48 domain-containing protein n=1 Tax=Strongyloides venezuelensis TaxID=75913 RepID=A0A0K0FMW4_STRVS